MEDKEGNKAVGNKSKRQRSRKGAEATQAATSERRPSQGDQEETLLRKTLCQAENQTEGGAEKKNQDSKTDKAEPFCQLVLRTFTTFFLLNQNPSQHLCKAIR